MSHTMTNQPTHANEAAAWLAATYQRITDIDTSALSLAQVEIIRRWADQLTTKCTAQLWAMEAGLPIPAHGDKAGWAELNDRWLES